MRHGVIPEGRPNSPKPCSYRPRSSRIDCTRFIYWQGQYFQAKSVIIADGGYEGIWQGNNIGLGIDLAMQTGLPVRNMEFTALTPFNNWNR